MTERGQPRDERRQGGTSRTTIREGITVNIHQAETVAVGDININNFRSQRSPRYDIGTQGSQRPLLADHQNIKPNIVKISEELDAKDICDVLFQDELLRKDDVERIANEKTQRDRTICLLRMLPKNSYQRFVEVLKKDHGHLVEIIEGAKTAE